MISISVTIKKYFSEIYVINIVYTQTFILDAINRFDSTITYFI